MKPSFEVLRQVCQGVDVRVVGAHYERLGEDYFDAFPTEAVAQHIRAVASLAPETPVQVLFDKRQGTVAGCTVVAFDYPGEFSMITGILAATGFNILEGHVFTYSPSPPGPPSYPPRVTSLASVPVALCRRCIVDAFVGTLDEELEWEQWAVRVRADLIEILLLLERLGAQGLARARRIVNERVAARLAHLRRETDPRLYPVQLDVVRAGRGGTTLRVTSQDTPAFLYALSNALSLQGVSIERVRIRTFVGQVEDELDIVDAAGRPIQDPERIDRIRFSVLLTKQFTHCLSRAPDPSAALERFERLTQEWFDRQRGKAWADLLQEPHALQDLAQILGASEFLWEDFIRSQYEALRPLVVTRQRPDFSRTALEARLEQEVGTLTTFEDRRRILNAWKDREMFLIDVDHLLHARADVRALAEPLTALAEVTVGRAAQWVYQHLTLRFGEPGTVAHLPVRWAVCGLGKFGGMALGYASDIELLFVYSDAGETSGPERISNREFFDQLAIETARFIEARREGIFHVDLRLRPYGESGPRACSLDTFCRYYGRRGEAQAYERLALTRLRHVAGDEAFGRQIERLRDELLYEGEPLDFDQLRRVRERQLREKASGTRPNAKFSPGALVDLEYYVQILQVIHGRDHLALRSPRLHTVLTALATAEVLSPRESEDLLAAYEFFRRLINALRMLRGHALDLFLPESDSVEFLHLARRMGYEPHEGIDPALHLRADFETHTARVRAFMERHFGRQALPEPYQRNVLDLILSPDPPLPMRERVLTQAGFADPRRAFANLRALAGEGTRREAFVRIASLAMDMLRHRADPDMALNNWERFVRAVADPTTLYDAMLAQPRRLDILLAIFAGSQFLSDLLVLSPDWFNWVTRPEILHGRRDRGVLRQELETAIQSGTLAADWRGTLRRFRRREMLRVGTRDIGLQAPLREVMEALSVLAETIVEVAAEHVWQEIDSPPDLSRFLPEAHDRFAVLALGKLGGAELNYSSDIDLMAVFDDEGLEPDAAAARRLCETAMERLVAALAATTEEGHAYRVDLRLRPHGRAGHLVTSLTAFRRYYERSAALWEIQALLKARPLVGPPEVSKRIEAILRDVLTRPRNPRQVTDSVRRLRTRATRFEPRETRNVKVGTGGLRDIEFAVQAMQLVHLSRYPSLYTGHTLQAIEALREVGLLTPEESSVLASDYTFLRHVEHYLQILEDLPTHEIPRSRTHVLALARRVGGPEATAELFLERLGHVQQRVRERCTTILDRTATEGEAAGAPIPQAFG